MVRLDGTCGDDARLAAANQIAETFDSHITGLFFNVLSSRIPDGLDGVDAKRLRAAKEAGDAPETIVFQRLTIEAGWRPRPVGPASSPDVIRLQGFLARAAGSMAA
ncbi:hypothetical protein [Bradyrhizobium erythrophlei]|uniref:hypothetical protein n=1 Tax=Bradyrhizobium erythrophlei TaxID=1437360 RepID=UPI000B845826|nr:hypothetical protein [Bradyrhizobium erythrophlei]